MDGKAFIGGSGCYWAAFMACTSLRNDTLAFFVWRPVRSEAALEGTVVLVWWVLAMCG